MNALLMDNLQGVRQIKAFGREAHEDARFTDRADELREGTLGIMRVWANYQPTMGFAGAIGFALVLWVGGRMVIHARPWSRARSSVICFTSACSTRPSVACTD
jgi:ATP-binding cassette subfamily B protein